MNSTNKEAVTVNLEINDTIARLQVSKAKIENEAKTIGRETGEKWAKRHAEYDELHRIANFRDGFGRDWGRVNWDGGMLSRIQEIITGEDSVSQAEYHEFWSDLVAGDFDVINASEAVQEEFGEGFLDGAEEVWMAVEDKL